MQEVQDSYGLPVISVLRLRDLMAHLEAIGDSAVLQSIRAYRDQYGVWKAGPSLTQVTMLNATDTKMLQKGGGLASESPSCAQSL